jgi:hypothetical protein
MKSYRVFVFDMGHVNAVKEFEAPSDEEAIAEARRRTSRKSSVSCGN